MFHMKICFDHIMYFIFRNQIKGYFWKKLEKLSYGMSYSYLLPGKWFIFWLLFLDTTGFENSYCHSKGYQGNFLFHEVLGGDKYTEYSTHVSIVRPYHKGCYFKILFDFIYVGQSFAFFQGYVFLKCHRMLFWKIWFTR